MKKINISEERCKGCGLCVYFCPQNCLKLSEKVNKSGFKYAVFTDEDKCKSCGFCFLTCPDVVIEVYK